MKKYVKISFSNVIMLSEDTKILEFNQYQIFDKAPFIIYADLECIIEKIDRCKNNPENSSTTKVIDHILSSFSISTISFRYQYQYSFRSIEKKHDVYRCKNCMKRFCEYLRKHAMKIINFILWYYANDILGLPNLARMSLMKCCRMLQNAKVTASIISELLKENQQGEGVEGYKINLPPKLGLSGNSRSYQKMQILIK